MSLPRRFSARALMTTAARMTAPEIAICQNGETLITGRAFTIAPRKRAPSRVPVTVPTPPPIDTPPITQAAMTLMDLAEERAGIRHFVLSVSPENDPSLAIVRKLGFVKTGEHMDDEDGLERVFELQR